MTTKANHQILSKWLKRATSTLTERCRRVHVAGGGWIGRCRCCAGFWTPAKKRLRTLTDRRPKTSTTHKVAAIGIGGSLAAPPLPHHRAYGSVHGGSRSCANTIETRMAGRAI